MNMKFLKVIWAFSTSIILNFYTERKIKVSLQFIIKQVRTNIGLADTLIFISFIYKYYLFDLHIWNRTRCTNQGNFCLSHLRLVYKPKYEIWCKLDVPCAQDPSIPIWLIWAVPDPVDRYSPITSVCII